MMHATCHTPACENAETPIPIPADPGDVVCGPCGQPITDLTATPPALPEEMPTWEL
jgi:hypothetical protein